MSWLTQSLSQLFMNPAFVLPGLALASLPIIIHLLSRLRYKSVRFAAMEFLLQSDEMNRRRLIIEQLLLLILRVLAVLLLMLVLARLVLDPSRMRLLRGATTHHVLILDDSLSMRQLSGSGTVFERAGVTLETLLTQVEGQSSSMRVSVLTMSEPERPIVSDRALDGTLIQEVIPRLRNLRCSCRSVSPRTALQAAENMLTGDGGVAPQVHVITDLRRHNWQDDPEVTEALKALGALDARVSLIQLEEETTDNIALSELSADTLAVAVGIPWRLHLTVVNHGERRSSGLRAVVSIDGNPLPVRVLIPDIEPQDSAVVSHDIVFQNPGRHAVEVRLDDDVLMEDNARFLAADVTDARSVLIVDDSTSQQDASFVAAALSADPTLSGIAADVRTSDVLTTGKLAPYDCIYLLNVRELPADATQQLNSYVTAGGGIAWFPDDQANTTWYNTVLRSEEWNLFPAPLATVSSIPEVGPDDDPQFQSIAFETHPALAIYNDPELPLAETIQVRQWFKVATEWLEADREDSTVRILARLKNGDPVAFEHEVGAGHVLTFLTTAGRRWTNWPVLPAAPGYVVTNMLIHQYLQPNPATVQSREIGDVVRFRWAPDEYSETVEVFLPETDSTSAEDTFVRLQAAPETPQDADNAPFSSDVTGPQLAVSIPQARRPGVYRVRRFPLTGEAEELWMALSVPATESNLTQADGTELEQQPGLEHLSVMSADAARGLFGSEAGRELRWVLVFLLIAVLICEQLLSLRLSFHPEVKA